jgi:Ala-tRNA(Pro) deacylase
MSINPRLQWYLESHQIDYDVVPHGHTDSMIESAQAARIPRGLVAKCVLLEDERGYVMAVVPASCRVNLNRLEDETGRHLELATEAELADIFVGCEAGAIPPFGQVYNIPTVIDESLLRLPEVYFEEGDHAGLVHVSGSDFRSIGWNLSYGHLGRPH